MARSLPSPCLMVSSFWPLDGLTSCLGAGLQLEPEPDPPYAPPFHRRLDASPLDLKANACLKSTPETMKRL